MKFKLGPTAAMVAVLAIASSALAREIREPTSAEREKVEEAVRKELLDPESARFEDLRSSVQENGSVHVCGKVNAKNTFGGYSGRKLFHTLLARDDNDPDREIVVATLDDSGMVEVAASLCQVVGLGD